MQTFCTDLLLNVFLYHNVKLIWCFLVDVSTLTLCERRTYDTMHLKAVVTFEKFWHGSDPLTVMVECLLYLA